jgi:hydrophobe/amphiphile efflux-1 (HAE1) family protein
VNISEPFIRRPIATTLLALAVILAGLAGYRMLPVSPLPQVDFPTINVSANLPGASPETMAAAVATPLERRLARIAGVTEITSVSSIGSTSLTLQFDLSRDSDGAARDVQAAIAAAAGDLPPNLPFRPNYRKVNPADSPILILALTSKTLPIPKVVDAATTVVAQKIAQVQGVGQVFVGGGQLPAVRVQVDPAALAGIGIGTGDVRAALGRATSAGPKGVLGGAERASTIQADTQLLGADAYRDVIITHRGGAAVRLGDVANVFDDVENSRFAAWTNGERSVAVIIRRQPGANIIDVVERVRALLPQLKTSISPAIDVAVSLDRTRTIRASVAEVEHALVFSVILVVLVVFLFLRSARATAIPSVAVPLSLVGTFGVMYLLDYGIDNLSLMALTIATGFVVDDAIVVTENITRYLEQGKSPLEAALEGAKQIGFTIVSITVSLLAVFIPVLLMGGIVGRLFREFAVVLSVAIAISAVVSLTLTPMMASRLLRAEHGRKPGPFSRLAERGFAAVLRGYERGLRLVLRHRKTTLLVMLGTVVLNGYLYVIVPKGLFPQQDTGQLQGISEAPPDISFPAMRERVEKVNRIVMDDPAVERVVAWLGGWNSTGNTGNISVVLKPREQRPGVTADQVIARLRPKLAEVPGIKLYLQSAQDVRLGGRPSRTQYQYTLQDPSLDQLRTWAPRVVEALRKVPELKDVATDAQNQGLELGFEIDRDTASRLGISPADIDSALYDAYGQRQVATTYTERNQYRVVMEVKPELQTGPDDVNSLYVTGRDGAQVPLAALVKPRHGTTSLVVNHQGQFPSVTLSFNLAEGASLSQAVEKIRQAELAMGLPASIRAGFAGTAHAFQASLQSQPWLILSALVAVYIVLGMLYESYVHPITILSTLPSAGVGALLALLLFDTEFSIIALIGIILLIGIVKKNAIMMIDFAIEAERDQGLSPVDAITQACLQRFRPILMTTLAALFGGLPLALGGGDGSELRRPLGIAIVGGLVFSQLLTLYTTPVMYVALDRFTRKKRHPIHGTEAPDELEAVTPPSAPPASA